MQKKIAEFNVGSVLYGTNGPNSDIDISGIFVEPIHDLLSPFGKCKQEISESVISKLDNGKNSSDAIDKKLYSLQKFVKLAYENNPNIIEMLYINDENILIDSPEYIHLRSSSHLFLNKNIVDTFYGYAISQENRMYQTTDKVLSYRKFYDMIKDKNPNDILLSHSSELLNNFQKKLKYNSTENVEYYFQIAEGFSLPFSLTIKESMNRLSEKIDKSSYRSDYILNKGYDFKFASHVVRLLSEGYEAITEHEIVFPLKNRELIKYIKEGKTELEEVKSIINSYKDMYKKIEFNNSLPKYGEYIKDVEDLIYSIYDRNNDNRYF